MSLKGQGEKQIFRMAVEIQMLDYENMILVFKNVFNEFSMDFYQTYLMRQQRYNFLDGRVVPRNCLKFTPDFLPPHIAFCCDEFLRKIKDLVHCPWTYINEAIDSEYGPSIPDGGYLKPSQDIGYTCTMIYSLGQTRKLCISPEKPTKKYTIEMEHNSLVCFIGPTIHEKYFYAMPPMMLEQPTYHYNLLLKFL